MSQPLLAFGARLLVALVLAFAGLSKLREPRAIRQAAEGFGLDQRLARWAGRLLAPAEILIALLLLPEATAFPAALAALSLFAVFALLIGWNLSQGRRPPCACFGEATPAPLSGWTLARDVGLLGAALLVVAQGPDAAGPGILAAATAVVARLGTDAALAAVGLAVLFQGLLSVLLLARGRRPGLEATATEEPAGGAEPAVASPPGWPPGTVAPSLDLPSLTGERATLRGLLQAGQDVALVFSDPACRPCNALLPEIALWQKRHAASLTIAVVSAGTPDANRGKAEAHGLQRVLLQGGREVAHAYRCERTPGAVVIDRDGRIASRVAQGGTAIRELVLAAAERGTRDAPTAVVSPPPPADRVQAALGDPAPPFRLPALRGGEIDLFEFAGRVAVILFFSPSCGFCRQMLPELLAWERAQTSESAPLVIVTRGGPVANAGLGFRSPVLMDEAERVAPAYGAYSTPSAVMVDAEGKLAAGVASGGPAVLALLRRADVLARAAGRLRVAG